MKPERGPTARTLGGDLRVVRDIVLAGLLVSGADQDLEKWVGSVSVGRGRVVPDTDPYVVGVFILRVIDGGSGIFFSLRKMEK